LRTYRKPFSILAMEESIVTENVLYIGIFGLGLTAQTMRVASDTTMPHGTESIRTVCCPKFKLIPSIVI
jgi:hypothetical protein